MKKRMVSENSNSISVCFVGSLADRIMSGSPSATIVGRNSGGIYLKSSRNWILYISNASYRGPLTIGLNPEEKITPILTPGMAVHIHPNLLVFPDTGLAISTEESRIWEPEHPNLPALPLAEQIERWMTLARGILDIHPSAEIETALRTLLVNPGTHQSDIEMKGLVPGNIQTVFDRQERSELEDTKIKLTKSMGKGPGLTPGGDDLIVGVLLNLNRWKPQSLTKDRLENFNKEIVNQAYRKTTTLSANLIECAANGLADERLINALDWIKSDSPYEVHTLIDGLLGWGNTSGVEAFIGFLFAAKYNNLAG